MCRMLVFLPIMLFFLPIMLFFLPIAFFLPIMLFSCLLCFFLAYYAFFLPIMLFSCLLCSYAMLQCLIASPIMLQETAYYAHYAHLVCDRKAFPAKFNV